MNVATWYVVRHSGRQADDWRVVHACYDHACALRRYRRAADALRQGSVALVDRPSGTMMECTSAPRLRSRW